MGLTKKSTGNSLLKNTLIKDDNSKIIALIGNPNVGKSTIFNALTGLNQHTGNWPGKTVESAAGSYVYNDTRYTLIDLPGTYSLFASSAEEEVSRDFVCFEKHDLTVVVVDATILERNLNLATQIIETGDNVIVCVNLMDEAKKRRINVDLNKLQEILKVPVIGTSANNKKSLNKLVKEIEKGCQNKNSNEKIINYSNPIEQVVKKMSLTLDKLSHHKNNRFFAIKLLENNEKFNNKIHEFLKLDKTAIAEVKEVNSHCNTYLKNNNVTDYQNEVICSIVRENNKISRKVINEENQKKSKIDKVLTSKIFGIPIMIIFLGIILWLTITGSNYPSALLSEALFNLNNLISKFLINIGIPKLIHDILIDGILKTLSWVISVMLPPMAIFFPLFTLLEDSGFLPRIAFNLDRLFSKAKCHGKQALSMCMGLGCNACGVVGCRIIDSPRERLIAILTNAFVPCNGRFPGLIAIITMFFAVGTFSNLKSSIILTGVLVLAIIVTLFVSKILSSTILKGMPSSFVLEMPPYRKPQIGKVIVRSIFDRTLFVLGRAISVAAPAGLVIWLMSNINFDGNSILYYCTTFLDPVANWFGMDGTILMAFILGFPANEIVIPLIIMSYMQTTTLMDYGSLLELKSLLVNNGWTWVTAVCTLIFTMFHFPCSTTILTIKKETNSKWWTFVSFILPTVVGLTICFLIKLISCLI
ncbi:MAG: ferrous iron transport protein B [Bacilli bacterium]|nr:ferrous iron transport protein B [Bacilli bacterium]